MTHLRLACFVFALVAASAFLFHGARRLSQGRQLTESLSQRAEDLKVQLEEQRRALAALTEELALAESQLARLPGFNEASVSEPERARTAEITRWLTAVKRLKALFEQRPDQNIPEMRLLKDDEWLRAGKRADLSNEDQTRQALAGVRTAAKLQFVSSLLQAMQKFRKAAGDQAPATVDDLIPYFESSPDADMLGRWQVANSGFSGKNVPAWIVEEKVFVDAEYDTRYAVNPRGGWSSMDGLLAWIPNYQERSQAAYLAYAQQGTNRPGNLSEILPYFDPPLDPTIIEKVLKKERARKP